MAQACLSGVKVNAKRTELAARGGHANATELADYLVKKGIPFREGHHIVGQLVQVAIAENKSLEQLSIQQFQAVCTVIEQDVYPVLELDACINARVAKGGTSKQQVSQAMAAAKQQFI
jgi:argininosuccinate lyase/amino-acid N-acetyltransferase